MNQAIKDFAKATEYYEALVDAFKYNLDPDGPQDGIWYYLRSDYSGRDFKEGIPLQYIRGDELDEVIESTCDDSKTNFDDGEFEEIFSPIIEDKALREALIETYVEECLEDDDFFEFFRCDLEEELLNDLYDELVNENLSQESN